jgi:hypothetical protein
MTPRRVVLFGSAVLTAGLVLGLVVTSVMAMRRAVDRNEIAVAALRAQLEAEGIEPAVEASDDPAEVIVTGPQGERGPRGEPGEDGSDGEPGADGQPGATGEPGSDGEPGAVGEPGTDGVQGPSGEPGPAGATGPAGADGTAGPPGPAPASFTFRWLTTTWTCSDPDGDGHYECATSP